MRIFLLTAGSYSDFHIEGEFSSQEKAEYAKSQLDLYDSNIKPLMLDQHYQPEMTPFRVEMDLKGNVESVVIDRDCSPGNVHGNWRVYKGYPNGFFNIHCWAKDETHAIKIANERRAEWIALNPKPSE